MYEFVQKLAKKKKKKKKERWDFNPRPIWLSIVAAAHHPPPHLLCQCPFYLYRTIRRPSEKADYTISFVWHSQPLRARLIFANRGA
jgi:hypothetical protein